MFDVHTLGGLDLVFVDVATSSYVLPDVLGDMDEKRTEEFVELRAADGARQSYSRGGEIGVDLGIIAFGDTLDEAEDRRLDIEAVLIAARNSKSTGSIVTYVEKDESNAVAKTWRLIGGQLHPVAALPGTGRIKGFETKFVAPAVVHLVLTKN